MKKISIVIIIVLLIIAGFYYFRTSSTPTPTNNQNAKINIDAVCAGALSYMTFPDSAASDKFVAECKEGKHPEVIEKYKADMNLGDGAQI